jgi:type VI secretion system secreted protein VgrG
VRELIFQFHESDADFIRRLCRRDGIAWFTAAGKHGQAPSDSGSSDTPVHTLVLFDDSMKLPESAAGTIRYHRDAATEERDSVTLWSASQQLVPGNVQRASWDYKTGTMAQASESNIVDQGPTGNDLSQLLSDSVIDVPHAGDSWSDYDRLGKPWTIRPRNNRTPLRRTLSRRFGPDLRGLPRSAQSLCSLR